MFYRITVVVTLAIFVMNVAGCTSKKYVRFFADEIQENTSTKIASVQLSSKVRRIVLKDNEVISINEEGVRIDTLAGTVTAMDVDGEHVDIDLRNVRAMQSASSDKVIFDENGGKIDAAKGVIMGKKPDSTQVNIALSEVCCLIGQGQSSAHLLLIAVIPLVLGVLLAQSMSSS